MITACFILNIFLINYCSLHFAEERNGSTETVSCLAKITQPVKMEVQLNQGHDLTTMLTCILTVDVRGLRN